MRDFPFQLSGGMQQRVMIAMALACEPQLLVADEPTTALDVTIQAQILELLRTLQARLGMAILLITHNLGIVGDVGRPRGGDVCRAKSWRWRRRGSCSGAPLHPYTRALLQSVPRLHDAAKRLAAIPGTVPRPGAMPPGCRFGPRCPYRRPECLRARPELRELGVGRFVRCPYAESLPDSGPATMNPELHRS